MVRIGINSNKKSKSQLYNWDLDFFMNYFFVRILQYCLFDFESIVFDLKTFLYNKQKSM